MDFSSESEGRLLHKEANCRNLSDISKLNKLLFDNMLTHYKLTQKRTDLGLTLKRLATRPLISKEKSKTQALLQTKDFLKSPQQQRR